jgi:hypothetical protein
VHQLNGWQWDLFAYKVTGGVSYFAFVDAGLAPDLSAGFITITLRAPESHDAPNLFPDAPLDLPAGSTCAEDGAASPATQVSGVAVVLRDWKPFPGANLRDPNVR